MRILITLLMGMLYLSAYAGQSPTIISKVQAREDFKYFSDIVGKVHPALSSAESQNQWHTQSAEALNSIDNDSILTTDLYMISARLMATLHDAHSNVAFPMQPRVEYMLGGGLSFPFSVEIRGDNIYLTEFYGNDWPEFAPGIMLISVNGVSSSELLNETRELVGSRRQLIADRTIAMNFRNYMWTVFGWTEDYTIEYMDRGQSAKILLPGITNREFVKNRERFTKPLREPYGLTMLPERDAARMRFADFVNTEPCCRFMDSAFSVLKANKCGQLIIDIRGNSGGRSAIVDTLMSYITDKSYLQYTVVEIRASNTVKEYYKERYPEQYDMIKDIPEGRMFSYPTEATRPQARPNGFSGALTLLTDGHTFSGAATFAGLFRSLGLGPIIGSETGGTIEYYGDLIFFEMPDSKIRFYVSPKRFVQHGGTNPHRGVVPDIIME